jgi:acyl-CoA synthetase (AMP-forming)/AMP-acid ligase II
VEKPELDFIPTMGNAAARARRLFGSRSYVVMPERRLTFAEVDLASRRVAKELLARGIGKGTRVAIHFSYGPEWAIAFFAVTRIGAVCLPMSTVYTPAELRKAVVHGDVDTLIVPRQLQGVSHVPRVEQAFPSLAGQSADGRLLLAEAPFLRSILVGGQHEAGDPPWVGSIDLSADGASSIADSVDDAMLDAAEAQVAPADWLCIIHTSGTTGTPKGVIHTHGAFLRHCHHLGRFNGMGPDSTQFSGLPWFWIGGLVLSIGQAIVLGFSMLCLERFDNEQALDLIVAERPVQIGMWGQLAQKFRQYVASTGRDVSMVPALTPVPGAPVDPELYHNSLGQTETLGPHTAAGPEIGQALDERHRGSFGSRVPLVEHRVIDPESGRDVAPGEQGEVVVRGYSLSAGLYKCERDEAFDDDGWLHTGDLGYFKDGYLFFKGRRTEMIKTLGSNVAPREVEVVLESAPGVGLAIVIGVPDEERGQVVGAVLVRKPGETVDETAVHDHAAAELSSYKVPRRTIVMDPDDLPMLGSGKPDKLALRAMLEAVSGDRVAT